MIRNQGSLLVRGFSPRDIMMQYMAKAGSPTKGRDASSHFGDIYERNVAAPISMLGDLIGVMAGVALGARYQGRNIACMTYIGDGGQSTGIFHESLNFAAVQKLGLVLIVENNLWGYSTPAEHQFAIKDLAQRAIAYGIPGVIVDGTDACQVYDAAHEACERARRGEGPTLIEAKMMRMKGHAIHDAAQYVPRPLFEYWQKRDPIARFENYLLKVKKWLTPAENQALIDDVEKQLEADRNFAEASPMPAPEAAEGGVYCDGTCHEIKPKYGLKEPRAKAASGEAKRERSGGAPEVATCYRYTSRRWPMRITRTSQVPMHDVIDNAVVTNANSVAMPRPRVFHAGQVWVRRRARRVWQLEALLVVTWEFTERLPGRGHELDGVAHR